MQPESMQPRTMQPRTMQPEKRLSKCVHELGQQRSLFADMPAVNPPPVDASRRVATPAVRKRRGSSHDQSQDHLAAAQRLAKKLRSGRRQAGQRQRAGIAICQHLIALLQDNEQAEPRQPS